VLLQQNWELGKVKTMICTAAAAPVTVMAAPAAAAAAVTAVAAVWEPFQGYTKFYIDATTAAANTVAVVATATEKDHYIVCYFKSCICRCCSNY
jgi:hypothetical protein